MSSDAQYKIQAKVSARRRPGGWTDVKMRLPHAMHSGLRKAPKTGETIPASFIERVDILVADQTVWTAFLGPFVAKNPFLFVKVQEGGLGQKVLVRWIDDRGQAGQVSTQIR